MAGHCGENINVSGQRTNLACSGRYTGGGDNAIPLPVAVPDQVVVIHAISACNGQTATLGPTTSTQTGSPRTCTSTGCLFGAPLAIPNASTTPLSHCVLNVVAGPATGSLVCDTGATNLDLSLSAVVYLTGDATTDPMNIIPGIQPCPLCSGGTCIGGPNHGFTCTPGSSELSGAPAYPTSHDCPPDPMLNVGTLPIAFRLTSGTVTWTGTVATNDPDSTASVQNRVFAGFCRDADETGCFEGSDRPGCPEGSPGAQQCWENGMAVGPACGGTYESCEQHNNGAFGPGGGGSATITMFGAASDLLSGPGEGTLVSIFSIPPSFEPQLDAAGDLPGPGAVSMAGTTDLCMTANPCMPALPPTTSTSTTLQPTTTTTTLESTTTTSSSTTTTTTTRSSTSSTSSSTSTTSSSTSTTSSSTSTSTLQCGGVDSDGRACDDNEPCTAPDLCSGGACIGQRLCDVAPLPPGPIPAEQGVRVDVTADPGATVEAGLFATVPAAAAARLAPEPLAEDVGEPLSKIKTKRVRRAGKRIVLKLRLNKSGRQQLKTSTDGNLRVVLRVIVRSGGRVAPLLRALTLRR